MNDYVTRSIWKAIEANDVGELYTRLNSVGCILFATDLSIHALDENNEPYFDSFLPLEDCSTEWWDRLSQKDREAIARTMIRSAMLQSEVEA